MKLGLGIGLKFGRRGGAAAGPTNTVAPEVTGTAERGEVLTCSTGTWTGTGTITYAYQWLRDGVEIAGATNSTYTLVVVDDNANIRCRVTATDNEGSRSAFSNVVGPVLGAPLNLTAPVLSGTETVGEELSVTDGTWQGQATITYAYQWRRDGVNISGATSNTYTLVAADYNTVIDCVVTATNSLDSATADSNDTGAIAGLAPTNTVAPSISGSTSLGSTLTRTSQGVYDAVPAATITGGQWRRNGTPIPGATGTTYDITLADSGADIDYLETATNVEGSITSDSNDITAQTFVAPTNSVLPSISGNLGLGDTLTATDGTWTGNPTPTITGGEWYRNGIATGVTTSTYTITLADDNAEITFRQTATNAVGSDTATSTAVQVQDFTAPVIQTAPSSTGNDPATIDDVLTRVEGTWSGNPTPTLAGEWYRNNVATGQTGDTYTITAADDDSFIFYRETATNAVGSASADSAAVTVEDFTVPAITGVPTIAGTEEVGETLTATAAAATGNPAPVTSWQWQRSANGVDGWANISGATSATYTLVAADETNYIRVQQIETNVIGSDTAVSVSTGEITSGAAGSGLLDSYTGAAAAFSLDTLIYSSHSVVDTKTGSETYNDPAAPYTVLVRRDTTPNAWRSFTHTEVGDGTLTTWVGAGNNGFVEVWYNQGSAGDAEQTTTANQPKIVDNGALVVENGKAALDIPSGDYFTFSTDAFAGKYPDLITVSFVTSYSENGCMLLGTTTGQNLYWQFGNGDLYFVQGGLAFGRGRNIADGQTRILNLSADATYQYARYNSVQYEISTSIPTIQTGSKDYRMYVYPAGVNWNWRGKSQCYIIYADRQDTDKAAIENALNNYYNVY